MPVVRLLYERGRFTPADTQATAAALFLYSFGLVGYTGVKVLAPAFYALGQAARPARGERLRGGDEPPRDPRSFTGSLGFRAIALGTALGSLVNAGLLVGALREARRAASSATVSSGPIARMGLAAVAMGAVAWLAAAGLERARRHARPAWRSS